ncbi:MAG: hypothetical protein HQK50_01045 [Oligoflexia bacterium]|nr:hypothetical protein [Oligoflexia bacterium]
MKNVCMRFILLTMAILVGFNISISTSNNAFAFAFDCETLRGELSKIQDTSAYDSKFNKSVVKWFELKQCDGTNFVVKVRGRFQHFENLLFRIVKVADWAYDFDISISAQGDVLNFHDVSDTYNCDGLGPDELRLAGSAFNMLATYLGNPYATTAVDRFNYVVGRIEYKTGNPIETAANAIAVAYTKIPR